jgi:hypothetical protein
MRDRASISLDHRCRLSHRCDPRSPVSKTRTFNGTSRTFGKLISPPGLTLDGRSRRRNASTKEGFADDELESPALAARPVILSLYEGAESLACYDYTHQVRSGQFLFLIVFIRVRVAGRVFQSYSALSNASAVARLGGQLPIIQISSPAHFSQVSCDRHCSQIVDKVLSFPKSNGPARIGRDIWS